MRMPGGISIVAVCSILFFCFCNKPSDKAKSSINFTSLFSAKTGITFNNTITENDSVNLIANEYTYMGSGVAIGDFNNDNLPDVFFGANQSSSKLYLNKGNFSFEDITVNAGVTTDCWVTGISITDVNNDGYDDIYVVCRAVKIHSNVRTACTLIIAI